MNPRDQVADECASNEKARAVFLGERVAQAGVSIVRKCTQSGKNQLRPDHGRAIFAHAVSKDERNSLAAHFNMILMRVAFGDVPGYASAIKLPARFLKAQREDDKLKHVLHATPASDGSRPRAVSTTCRSAGHA